MYQAWFLIYKNDRFHSRTTSFKEALASLNDQCKVHFISDEGYKVFDPTMGYQFLKMYRYYIVKQIHERLSLPTGRILNPHRIMKCRKSHICKSCQDEIKKGSSYTIFCVEAGYKSYWDAKVCKKCLKQMGYK